MGDLPADQQDQGRLRAKSANRQYRCERDVPMVLTSFQMRYVSREDRALLRIELNGGDAYAFWLTRARCLELLIRAQEMRVLAPDRVADMERMARHPARVQAMSLDPRGRDLETRHVPLGDQPLLLDSVDVMLLNHRVVCTLSQEGLFQLQLALCWEFFSHWMLMLENMDEEADWDLTSSLTHTLGSASTAEALALEDLTDSRDTARCAWRRH